MVAALKLLLLCQCCSQVHQLGGPETERRTLAGLVRLLRKVFSQLSGKNREFVTHSLKFEKNAAQQVRYSLLDYLISWQTYCWGSLLHHRRRYSKWNSHWGSISIRRRSRQ